MEVRLKPHNLAHIRGIQRKVPILKVKVVVDCILDAIVYSTNFKVAHQPINTSESRKLRLNARHYDYLQQYSANRHVDSTTAFNLILDDYFSAIQQTLAADTNTNAASVQETETNEPEKRVESVKSPPIEEKPLRRNGNSLLGGLRQ